MYQEYPENAIRYLHVQRNAKGDSRGQCNLYSVRYYLNEIAQWKSGRNALNNAILLSFYFTICDTIIDSSDWSINIYTVI